MEDEAGQDGKVLAVPTDKILSIYTQWQKPEDLNPMRLKTIAHFFEHYKDLEKASGSRSWAGKAPSPPTQEIMDGIANYNKALLRFCRLPCQATMPSVRE
jgi:inorganic pyrophosphatase